MLFMYYQVVAVVIPKQETKRCYIGYLLEGITSYFSINIDLIKDNFICLTVTDLAIISFYILVNRKGYISTMKHHCYGQLWAQYCLFKVIVVVEKDVP